MRTSLQFIFETAGVALSLSSLAAISANAAALAALDHGTGNIYRIDTNQPGFATLIGHVPVGTDLYELVAPSADRFYTFDRDANLLITVSSSNAQLISSVALDQDVFVSRRGFDLSPSGILYGVLPGMQLRTINPTTGASILLAPITGASRVEAIAFAPDGQLFASGSAGDDINSENLYRLNITTGVLTLVGATGFTDIDSLAFGTDGFLYGADSEDNLQGHLYRLNLQTGAGTDLGPSGVNGLNGLAGIPEPQTLALLGFGALTAMLRRRSHRWE